MHRIRPLKGAGIRRGKPIAILLEGAFKQDYDTGYRLREREIFGRWKAEVSNLVYLAVCGSIDYLH